MIDKWCLLQSKDTNLKAIHNVKYLLLQIN